MDDPEITNGIPSISSGTNVAASHRSYLLLHIDWALVGTATNFRSSIEATNYIHTGVRRFLK